MGQTKLSEVRLLNDLGDSTNAVCGRPARDPPADRNRSGLGHHFQGSKRLPNLLPARRTPIVLRYTSPFGNPFKQLFERLPLPSARGRRGLLYERDTTTPVWNPLDIFAGTQLGLGSQILGNLDGERVSHANDSCGHVRGTFNMILRRRCRRGGQSARSHICRARASGAEAPFHFAALDVRAEARTLPKAGTLPNEPLNLLRAAAVSC
jgi:hypothetical protein